MTTRAADSEFAKGAGSSWHHSMRMIHAAHPDEHKAIHAALIKEHPDHDKVTLYHRARTELKRRYPEEHAANLKGLREGTLQPPENAHGALGKPMGRPAGQGPGKTPSPPKIAPAPYGSLSGTSSPSAPTSSAPAKGYRPKDRKWNRVVMIKRDSAFAKALNPVGTGGGNKNPAGMGPKAPTTAKPPAGMPKLVAAPVPAAVKGPPSLPVVKRQPKVLYGQDDLITQRGGITRKYEGTGQLTTSEARKTITRRRQIAAHGMPATKDAQTVRTGDHIYRHQPRHLRGEERDAVVRAHDTRATHITRADGKKIPHRRHDMGKSASTSEFAKAQQGYRPGEITLANEQANLHRRKKTSADRRLGAGTAAAGLGVAAASQHKKVQSEVLRAEWQHADRMHPEGSEARMTARLHAVNDSRTAGKLARKGGIGLAVAGGTLAAGSLAQRGYHATRQNRHTKVAQDARRRRMAAQDQKAIAKAQGGGTLTPIIQESMQNAATGARLAVGGPKGVARRTRQSARRFDTGPTTL